MSDSTSLANYQNNQSLLNKLEKLKRGRRDNKKQGQWYTAVCPAHDDRSASLSVFVPDDESQHIGFNCHAGCTHADVMAALGNPARPKRVVEKSTKKRSGKRGNGRLGKRVKSYVYTDESGQKLFRKNRYEPKDFRIQHLNGRYWKWGLGSCDPVLYNLPNVIAAEQVLIVEGEKDADQLNALGFVATCNYDGASKDATFKPKWRPELYNGRLAGKQVVIFPDNDEAGRVHADYIARSLQGIAASVKVVRLAGLGQGGDVSDWLAAGNDPSTLPKLISETAEYQPLTNIYGTGDDVTVIDVPNGRYLGDVIQWSELPRLVSIHAGCGVGKTTAVMETLDGKKLVLFSLVSSLEQMKEKLQAQGISVGYAYQGEKDVNGQDVILCTYDSLPYVLPRIDASQYSLIVDEIHNVATSGDPHYRGKALNHVLDVLGGAWQRVVLMTGTPFPSTHPDLAKFHHVNIASVIREQRAQMVRYGAMELNGHQFKMKRRDAIVHHITKERDSVHVVLLNDKRTGRENLIAGLVANELDSKTIFTLDAEQKETEAYRQLIESGQLPNECKVLIVTSVLAESTNLYSHVDFIHIADSNVSPHIIQQFVSRPRKQAAQMVYIYSSGTGNGRYFDLAQSQGFISQEAHECLRAAQSQQLLEPNDQAPEAQRARRMWRRWNYDSRHYLMTDEDENGRKLYALNYAGIDNRVLKDFTAYCHRNPLALEMELARYGWVFEKPATAVNLASPILEIAKLIGMGLKMERLKLFAANVNTAVSYGYRRLVENVKNNTIIGRQYTTAVNLLSLLDTMTTQEERQGNDLLMNELLKVAADQLKATEGSNRKRSRLQRRMEIQLYGLNDPLVLALLLEFANDLKNLSKLTSEEIGRRVRAVYQAFPELASMAAKRLPAYWATEAKERMSDRAAVKILGDIFELKRTKGAAAENGKRPNVYQIISNNPIQAEMNAIAEAREKTAVLTGVSVSEKSSRENGSLSETTDRVTAVLADVGQDFDVARLSRSKKLPDSG